MSLWETRGPRKRPRAEPPKDGPAPTSLPNACAWPQRELPSPQQPITSITHTVLCGPSLGIQGRRISHLSLFRAGESWPRCIRSPREQKSHSVAENRGPWKLPRSALEPHPRGARDVDKFSPNLLQILAFSAEI